MAIILDGTAGLANNATDLSYTGTLTGSTGVVNLGSGQVYKDASGNVGIGTSTPAAKLEVSGSGTLELARFATTTDNTPSIGIYSNGSIRGKLRASSAETALLSQGATPLLLGTNDTERARIDSSGNLLVGTTSSLKNASHSFQATGTSSAFWAAAFQHNGTSAQGRIQSWLLPNTNSSSSLFVYAENSSGLCFAIEGNGNVINTNNSYGAISDSKLKENVTDATPKLDKLNQVRVVNFNLIGEEQKQLGVIAQELEQIFPSMVDESPDRDKEGNDLGTTTKSVKYSVFVPMLIKAIQEQQAIIVSLQDTLTALTTRITALEAK